MLSLSRARRADALKSAAVSRSTPEPLLRLRDAGRARSGKQKAEQHSCSVAVQQFVEHTREQARLLRAQVPYIAQDILEAAKTSARLNTINAASSEWSAVVPADPGHAGLWYLVEAHLKQLCEGSGIEILNLNFNDPSKKTWWLRFQVGTPAAEGPVTRQ